VKVKVTHCFAARKRTYDINCTWQTRWFPCGLIPARQRCPDFQKIFKIILRFS